MAIIADAPTGEAATASSDDRSFAVRLMDHLVVPTFVIDRDGRVIIWNRACERLTGVAARDVLGTREHWRAFYDAERPCLADLLLWNREAEAVSLYAAHTDLAGIRNGLAAENWCVMPKAGKRLYLALDAGRIFDDAGEIVAVVESLRDITAQKIAEAELQALASSDGLTAIGNRRFFDRRLEDEWRRARRNGSPMSLLLLDIDYFKQFNDAFGHQRGDDCLRLVAATIVGQLFRAGDVAARYGGEEFAVILPDADAIGAFEVADRIRTAIENLELPNPAPRGRGKVTASIGVASVEALSPHPLEKLVCFADIALYRAKEAGRNRVAAYEDAPGCRSARFCEHTSAHLPTIASPECVACRLTAATSGAKPRSDRMDSASARS
jgi:diguanylate cyclase (GGDEF)-like protein/PAS domain S-box-containing protein